MTLDELGRCLRTAKASRESSPSFLEAIERSSDENLISKYLLFLFRNDIELLNSVLRKSHPKESVELESIDNSVPLHRIRLKKGTSFTLGSAQGLPEGTPSISGEALISDDTDLLYFEGDLPLSSGRFTAIPSALWQNRGDSSMRIWIPEAD